jgi:hypothetical protein
MADTENVIERLWYVSPFQGPDKTVGGVHIRAASEGLLARRERIQFLDRYLRYYLPRGTDRYTLQPEAAPVSLELLQTERGERLLVHKIYKGKYGIGTPGAYAIHLLTDLPSTFSTANALALWRSDFWDSFEEECGDATQLKPVSLATLRKYFAKHGNIMRQKEIDSAWMERYLPLFMRAYLTWRRNWEQPVRLYLAASPDEVAALLSALVLCLPADLMQGLTFSTYEEISTGGQALKSLPLLVGTCWLPGADGKINPLYDLPPECYSGNIAINCYSSRKTELMRDASIDDYVAYAADCLLTKRTQDLYDLRRLIQNVDVNTFLLYYSSVIGHVENPSREDITLYFSQPRLAAKMVSKESVKKAIMQFGLQDKGWFMRLLTPAVRAELRGNRDFEELSQQLGVSLIETPEHIAVADLEPIVPPTTMLDQLCYTWSTVGYGSLSAGLRIRAASTGLQVINDERVKSLDRYLRYNLPQGADRLAIQKNLDLAPLSLALIRVEQGARERILVHKKYTGRDGVGRLGNFFIHLLASLPDTFSVADAISLWRSSFWYTSEARLGKSIELPLVSLDQLSGGKRSFRTDLQSEVLRRARRPWETCFPQFVRAYLTWRKRWEQRREGQEPPRLYMAAPPDVVAVFIGWLTLCLPAQLLKDLTFSTYESDVLSKDQVLLVGTSWIADATGKVDSSFDLPQTCYQEDVAINCYRPRETRPDPDPLVTDYADYAAGCLVAGPNHPDGINTLKELLESTGNIANLDTKSFLKAYEDWRRSSKRM